MGLWSTSKFGAVNDLVAGLYLTLNFKRRVGTEVGTGCVERDEH
jgi:hypothetical protein